MSSVIQLHTFHFAPDILKFENNKGEIEQRIIIVLRRDDCHYPVISPATSLLNCWNGLKDKSKYEYGRRLCEFLNYAYFIRRIKEFSEIDTSLVVDFLNELGKTHTRSYVQDSVRYLKQCFFTCCAIIQIFVELQKRSCTQVTQKIKQKSFGLLWTQV
ncbi:MAG: hypothetical protein ACI33I_00485 [Clostridium sp.]